MSRFSVGDIVNVFVNGLVDIVNVSEGLIEMSARV